MSMQCNIGGLPQIGILCYDIQHEQFFYRLQEKITPVRLKVYPLYHHLKQQESRVRVHPSGIKGRYLGVDVPGSTPEGFASNINFGAAWRCGWESDIVVLFGLQGATAMLAAFFATVTRRTLVSVNQTVPVEVERRRRWWIRLSKRWLLSRCDIHIYQSPSSREVLTQVYNIPQDRLFSSPYEAGASSFKQLLSLHKGERTNVRRELGVDHEVMFLFVGNLHPFKGVPQLIEASALLPKGTEFVSVFAGPEEPLNKVGGTIEYYMEIAKRLGIDHKVKFLGDLEKSKLAGLYLASDVVVLPTRKDTFGKVLVEGAVASKPLITTSACGSAGVIVVDGDNGFVVDSGDAEGLADAMTKLLNVDLRERMGARSREIVDDRCNEAVEIETFSEAIRYAMNTGRSGRVMGST